MAASDIAKIDELMALIDSYGYHMFTGGKSAESDCIDILADELEIASDIKQQIKSKIEELSNNVSNSSSQQ